MGFPALPSLPATGEKEHYSHGQFFCKGLHTSMTLSATLSNKLRATHMLGKCPTTDTCAYPQQLSHTKFPHKEQQSVDFFNRPIIFQFASPSLLHTAT